MNWQRAAIILWLTLFAGAGNAHEGALDANGCHGRAETGVEHCHVAAVPLAATEPSTFELADARRGARELRLPDCMTCEEIRALQLGLAELGHPPGPIDGIIGPLTRAAIESYQRSAGLPVDGHASAALIARVLGEGG